MDVAPAQALIRFGFGPRAGQDLPAEPRSLLAAEISAPDPTVFSPDLPSTADALTAIRERREQRREQQPGPSAVRPLFKDDAVAQLGAVLETPSGFRERLVWFWTNHFTVSRRHGRIAPLAGPYVREAIRPNVAGPFSTLLAAVMRHPAMLIYLDNAGSIGPDSPAGRRRGRGLNENLARECLELHTVGVEAGYSQADVTAFAAILTGWSVAMNPPLPGFVFRPGAHQPGDKTVMGRTFPQGEAGGVLALEFLANHPATATHLARKLATHFVADTPTASEIAHLAGRYRDTGGDLGAVSLALLDLPRAWRPGTKLRTPLDHGAAVLRALGPGRWAEDDPDGPGGHAGGRRMLAMLQATGQPLWMAPLPNGWPDRAPDWSGPEAMLSRVDWNYAVGSLGLGPAGDGREPIDIARTALGPLLRPATERAMAHAGDRRDALAMLFSSPEFARR